MSMNWTKVDTALPGLSESWCDILIKRKRDSIWVVGEYDYNSAKFRDESREFIDDVTHWLYVETPVDPHN